MIGFDGDGNVMGGPGNIADADVGTAGAMEGATASEGLGNVTSANPTFSFTQDQAITPQIEKQKSFVNQLKSFLDLSPMKTALSWGMSMMPEQMRAPTMNMNIDQLASGVQAMGPGFELGPDLISSSFNGQMSVPMTGFGANMGIASNIANIGGKNLHMGPGMPMSEDFFPGYGVNPFSGVAMADPSDPYIRKNRGSEIVAMIGS